MEILSVLIDPILPVFAILMLGYLNGRSGSISLEEARIVNRFAMNVLLPILVFDLIANAPILRFSVAPVLLYAVAEMVIFAGGYLLASRLFGRPTGEAVLLGFCGVFANNALYVLPVSLLLYGEGHVLPITAIITLDSTVNIGGTMILLQAISLGRAAPRQVALNIARTPMIQAIALGVGVSLLGVSIPGPLQTFLDFSGAGAAPAALYALGVVMSGTRISVQPVVIVFSAIKLLVFPATIWLGLELLASDDPGRALFQLGAAGPAGATAISLALLYNIRTDAIAQVILWTSLLSLITLAVLA